MSATPAAAVDANASHEGSTLAEWLRSGPFTLALASSFFGFYAHTGALQALEDCGIIPSRVCGSSSGAVISSAWAGGMDARTALRDLVIGLKRDDILMPIWKGALGFGLYRINEDFLLKASPVNRLGQGRCPVSISTYDVLARKTVIWTEGDAHKIVAASCAVPFIMQPVWLSDGRLHVDGGVRDLLGLASCGAEERVLSIDLCTVGLNQTRIIHKAILGTQDNPTPLKQCVKLQLSGLPMVGPNTMLRGRDAMEAARALMGHALQKRSTAWGNEGVVEAHLTEVASQIAGAAAGGGQATAPAPST